MSIDEPRINIASGYKGTAPDNAVSINKSSDGKYFVVNFKDGTSSVVDENGSDINIFGNQQGQSTQAPQTNTPVQQVQQQYQPQQPYNQQNYGGSIFGNGQVQQGFNYSQFGNPSASYDIDMRQMARQSVKFGLLSSLASMVPFGLGANIFQGGFTNIFRGFAKAVSFNFDFGNSPTSMPQFHFGEQFVPKNPTQPQVQPAQTTVADEVQQANEADEAARARQAEEQANADRVAAEKELKTKRDKAVNDAKELYPLLAEDLDKCQTEKEVNELVERYKKELTRDDMTGKSKAEVLAWIDSKGYQSKVAGNCIDYTDENGKTSRISFNKDGKVTYVNDASSGADTRMRFDDDGKRTTKTTRVDKDERYSYTETTTYDSAGNVVGSKKTETDRGNYFQRQWVGSTAAKTHVVEERKSNVTDKVEGLTTHIDPPKFTAGAQGFTFDPKAKTLENANSVYQQTEDGGFTVKDKKTNEVLTYDSNGNLTKQVEQTKDGETTRIFNNDGSYSYIYKRKES